MPFFRTGVLQDAFIHHEGLVEADSPEEASQMAVDAWKGENNGVILTNTGTSGYDDVTPVDPADIEELAADEYAAAMLEQQARASAFSVQDTINGAIEAMGWNSDSLVGRLGNFIESQGLAPEFAVYIARLIAQEQAAAE